MAWRVNGALKPGMGESRPISRALEAKSLEQAIARNLQLDQGRDRSRAQSHRNRRDRSEETRSAVVGGAIAHAAIARQPGRRRRSGPCASTSPTAKPRSEQMSSQQRAHDETLNHLAEGIAVFDAQKRLVFHNRAFEKMWALDPAFLQDRPDARGVARSYEGKAQTAGARQLRRMARARTGALPRGRGTAGRSLGAARWPHAAHRAPASPQRRHAADLLRHHQRSRR